MSFDINNQYTGTFYGTDRKGFTTPDPDGTEIYRPFLVNPYPAPWLPGRRRDEGHPVGAQVVLSAGYLVGQDKSGGLVPAGLKSGSTGVGGNFCLVKYGQDDVGMAFNPKTGLIVSAAGEYVLLAAPSTAQAGASGISLTINVPEDGKEFTIAIGTQPDIDKMAVGQKITVAGIAGVLTIAALASGKVTVAEVVPNDVTEAAMTYVAPVVDGVTLTAADIAFAKSCDLIPGGTARPVGYAVRNVFQYLGGVTVIDTTGGMHYKQDGMLPPKFRVHNYMHEPGTALQTSFGLRVPFIGADLSTMNTLAAAGGLSAGEYTYDDFSRSFVHCVGTLGNSTGNLYRGASVVADDQNGGIGSGHFRPYDSTKHSYDQIIGRVIGIEQIYPIKDFADRVRTQFDRAQSMVGPFADKNPTTFMMGGSSTKGLDVAVNLSTKGLLRKLLEKGVAPADIPVECGTYVWIGVRTI